MRKMLFILNPNAGMRKANKVLSDMIAVFNRADYDVSVYITAQQGDAKKCVLDRAKEMDLVVCCGGDGTFNETVAGLMECGADIALGYIPAGSTNDFANSLGLSTDFIQAAQNIVSGSPQQYDIGCFNGRYFTYVASFGAFTKASYATPQSVKNALGHTAYLLSGIQELSQLRSLPVKIELDGEVLEDSFLFGAICNSTSVAGILTLDPRQVDMRDGLFEILLVRAPKDLAEIGECIQAVQKQQYNCKMITFRSAKQVKVYADPQMCWTLDGEKEPGHSEIQIDNLHLAIRLVK